jgi:hypothetical protein
MLWDELPSARDGDEPPVTFLDARGTRWQVNEVRVSAFWRRADRCLILESENAIQRVWEYPPDWRALPPERLVALLEAR